MKKSRLDALLVDRSLFETRSKAQAAIMAGLIKVDGKLVTKAGEGVAPEAKIELVAPACPYVSRGGLKLEGALKAFQPLIKGRICADVGSSTGGFTDCLLQAGAAKVYAVDVGTAQLDAKLRADPRVVSLEQTHAKSLGTESFDPKPDFAVIDVSFISLAQVLPPIIAALKIPFEIIALIKPQFEVGPKLAPKGVVRDPANHQVAIAKIRAAAATLGLAEKGFLESPLKGPKGNVEFLIYYYGG